MLHRPLGTILLVSLNLSDTGVRVATELAKAGCDVVLCCPRSNVCRHARGIRVVHSPRGLDLEKAVLFSLRAAKPEIVIPCDDVAVRALHAIYLKHPEYKAMLAQSLGAPDWFRTVELRSETLQQLEDVTGICMPEWTRIRSHDDLKVWSRSMGPDRFVLKREGTVGGAGVRIVRAGREADTTFEELRRDSSALRKIIRTAVDYCFNLYTHVQPQGWDEMVAQRYVPGRAANCAMLCDEGEVLAFIGMEVLDSKTEVSRSAILRRVENHGMEQTARAIAAKFKLSGFHGVDFILEQGTNQAWFLELNPRVTPIAHLPFGEGADLVSALLEILEPGRGVTRKSIDHDVVALFPRHLELTERSPHLKDAYNDVDWSDPGFVAKSVRRLLGHDLLGWTMRTLGRGERRVHQVMTFRVLRG